MDPTSLVLAWMVDAGRLDADVRALSGVDAIGGAALVSRHVDHPDHERAGDYLLERLSAIDGLEVEARSFEAEDRTWLRNLVADLPGADPSLPMVVIGAHWDSTASATSGWSGALDPAPGADDDASGCAVVLELARLLSQREWERTIRFVLFDSEEQGLHGSVALSAEMAADGEQVELMYSLDPVGYNSNQAGLFWVTYDPRWPEPGIALSELASAVAPALQATALERTALIGNRSDHKPFWDEGYPALHVASFPQPPTYHTVDDTVSNVDPAFMAEVTELMVHHVSSIATPVDSGEGEGATSCGCSESATMADLRPILLLPGFRRLR